MINWPICWKLYKITISNEDYKCCFVKIKDDGEKELKCAAMEKVK